MAVTKKDTLKTYFTAGAIPSQFNYEDLIDSCFPVAGNGININRTGAETLLSVNFTENVGKGIITFQQQIEKNEDGEEPVYKPIGDFSVNQKEPKTINIEYPVIDKKNLGCIGKITIEGNSEPQTVNKYDDNTDVIKLSAIAFSGSWDDLDDKPYIPKVEAQVQANWTEPCDKNPAYIHNKPDYENGILFIRQNKIEITPMNSANEHISDFTSASETPVYYNISAPDWNASANAANGIQNKPTLSKVAHSGIYNDLLYKPALPYNKRISIYRNKNEGYDQQFFGAYGGNGATATAEISTAVTEVVIIDGGSGYDAANPPSVTVSNSATGKASTFNATVNEGRIIRIATVYIADGYSYSTPVTVTIDAPAEGANNPRQATATAILDSILTGITVTAGGSGYTKPPLVTILGGNGATATSIISGGISGLIISDGGHDYTDDTTVTFESADGNGADAEVSLIIEDGVITDFVMRNAGSGYTAAPTVQIGGNNGSGAMIQAQLNGHVDGITIGDNGYGFSETPKIIVGGSPITFTLNQATDGEYDLGLGETALTNDYNDLDNLPEIELSGDVLSEPTEVDENGIFSVTTILKEFNTSEKTSSENYEYKRDANTVTVKYVDAVTTDGRGRLQDYNIKTQKITLPRSISELENNDFTVKDEFYTEFKDKTNNRLNTLETIGGRWCGRDFETKQDLDDLDTLTSLPNILRDDFTYVINDETHPDEHGRAQICLYRWKDTQWVFAHVTQEDPIGKFTNRAFGVLMGSTEVGSVAAQLDGTGKVNSGTVNVKVNGVSMGSFAALETGEININMPILLDVDISTNSAWIAHFDSSKYGLFGFKFTTNGYTLTKIQLEKRNTYLYNELTGSNNMGSFTVFHILPLIYL